MKIDPRFIQDSGAAIFTGNELLVKGALEAEGGVHLMTGYPGSPIAAFFDTLEGLAPLLDQHGVCARMANNEALSVAMVNGAQMAGCRAITAMKSVGLHVASDALALGVLGGTNGESGGLVIVGDDPWSDSTQVPADSRFLAEHCRLPIVEPSTPQEVKDWVDLSFKLGRAGGIYIGYLVTVTMADGGGSVRCRPNHYPALNQNQRKALSYVRDIEPNLEEKVLLPPRSWRRELGLEEQFTRLKTAARKLGINRILHGPVKDEVEPLGLIAAGAAFGYLQHALYEMGLTGKLPILKLGMTYPLDEQIVTAFARKCKQVIVVEERRSFVERQIIEALAPLRQSGELTTEVYGKSFPKPHAGIPATRGLNPSILVDRLAPIIQNHPTLPIELTNGHLAEKVAAMKATADFEVDLPVRTPAYCPGCPHRDSSSALLELRKDLLDADYMLAHHNRKPVDLVAHGDTGCYTMMMFEPNKPLMHNYSGMGLGGATGAGVDPFIDNKQLVFMGDGTFFHSGQTAISQSIYNGQDITYIILENKTTAMTGHQTHAGRDVDLTGHKTTAIDIEQAVLGLIPKQVKKDVRVVRIDPSDRTRYRKLLEQTLLADGVKIVIADKECGITYHRRIRRAEVQQANELGYLPSKTHMNVATDVCEFCLECTTQTGCPGLKITDTDYGPKIQTDMSWCVNDGACHRIGACPSFEEVTVTRSQPPRMGDEHVALDDLPEPPRPIHADQDTWRCYLAGVGGMGIGLCTSILVSAGHEMGYHVQFLDKKGLAIRNGGVFSQLVYTRSDAAQSDDTIGPPSTPLIPYGQADLLLGVDLLEACRGIDPSLPYRVASPGRTAAVINTAKTPTILTLMGKDDFDVNSIEQTLRRYTHPDHFFAFNVGDLCERVLDTKLFANIMMLGVAFQKGLIPLKYDAIANAVRKITGRNAERNLRAFDIGRKIAVKPELFVVEFRHEYETARQALRRKTNLIEAWYGSEWVGRVLDRGKGPRLAKQFRVLMRKTFRATRGLRVDDQLMRDVVIRAYDCLVWGGIDYADAYCKRLVEVFHKDHPQYDYAATRAVVQNLARVMLIKDEVYVSAMLTSPEKYRRDRRRYNVNPERGDRIKYLHHNKPEFDIFGRKVRFELKARDWQLRLMSSCGFARGLLPKWHAKEKAYRDWFMGVVDRFEYDGPRDYQRWVAILSTPANVTGFREVRYPKQDAARKKAEALLKQDPETYEPPTPGRKAEGRTDLELPVLSAGPA